MYVIYLGAAVLINLIPWLVSRRVVSGSVNQAKLGIYLSLTVAISAVIGLIVTGERGFSPISAGLGVVQGISFSVGYCILILQALEIGPIALTTLFNNMGLLGPTIIGLLFFSEPAKSPLLLGIGFVLVLLTMILTSVASGKKQIGEGRQVSRRWFWMAFWGWIFSCFSMAAQYVNSQLTPECVYSYMIAAYSSSALILIIYGLKRRQLKPNREEVKGGVIMGLMQTINAVVTFAVLAKVPYIVYYPVSVASPIFIIMLIGHFFYKDPMDRNSWASMILGILGIVLVAVFG